MFFEKTVIFVLLKYLYYKKYNIYINNKIYNIIIYI